MGAGKRDVAHRWLAVGGFVIGSAALPVPAGAAQRPDAHAHSELAASRLPAAEPGLGTSDVARLRTRTTQTFPAGGGSYAVRVSGESLNFRDSLGRWQPIDNRLKIEGDQLQNVANRYRVSIPRRLGSGGVRVSHGDAWIEFAPQAVAARTAKPRGAEVAFAGAWPGVELRYAATADAVKEALVVRDLASIRDFVFDLRVPPGHTPVADRSGAVAVTDQTGVVKLRLSRSTMVDAAGAATNSAARLRRGPHGWQLVLLPDREWLSEPSRTWPVTIDPTVSFGAPADVCNLWKVNGNETGSNCDPNMAMLVGTSGPNETNPYDYRLLLRFAPQLPPGAVVESATLDLHAEGAPPFEEFSVYEMTTDWSAFATWETADGINDWIGEGASLDHVPAPLTTSTFGDLVRRWTAGETANAGLLVTRSSGCLCYIGTPELLVQYAPTDDPAGLQAVAAEEYTAAESISSAEAHRRLRLQDRVNNLVDDLVDAIEPTDFGGIWFDDAAGGRIKIGIDSDQPTPPPAKTDEAEGVLADHSLLDDTDFVSVQWALDQLEDAAGDVSAALASLLDQNKVEVGVEEPLNAVIVTRADLDPTELATLNAAVAAETVTVTVQAVGGADLGGEGTQGPPPSVCDITDAPPPGWENYPGADRPFLSCDDPFRGGVGIIGELLRHDTQTLRAGICTGGFFARSKDDNKPYILTAGHCFDYNDGPESQQTDPPLQASKVWMAFDKGEEEIPIGDPWSFDDKPTDAGIITVQPETPYHEGATPGWIYETANRYSDPPTQHREEHEIHSVPTINKSLSGSRICFTSAVPFGNSPRHTSCAKVSKTSDDFEGRKNVLRLDVCNVMPGSSGGPVFKNNRAYGLIFWSRRQASFLKPCHIWATKARVAADSRNVYIVTTQ